MFKVPSATTSTSSLEHAGGHADALKQTKDEASGGFSTASDDARLDALKQPPAQTSGTADAGSRSPRASFATTSSPVGGKPAAVPPPPPPPPPPSAPALRPAAFRMAPLRASTSQSSNATKPAALARPTGTQAVGSTSAIGGAATTTPTAAAHGDDKTPDDIQHTFKTSGLLIRTLQMKHAHKELHNCGVTIDEASRQAAEGGGHGGLRKWSLAHADLKPQYYRMGPDSNGPLARHIAVLAMPDLAGEHVVGVHEKDQSSGNITSDTKTLRPEDSKHQVGALLDTLKGKQGQHGDIENCEIQTVGIEPAAIAGLMFNKPGGTWEGSKAEVQTMLSKAGPEFHGRSFPVFTFAHDDGTTTLTHIDTLRAPSPTPATTASTTSTD